jgi:hypothetical protein
VIEKTKCEFIEGFKSALETARIFNNVCTWSMTMLPHPEYAGNYSWFSQWSLHNRGQIEQRKPWHQTINFKEAEDIFQKVERLIEAGKTARQIGVELDIEKIKANFELLKPDHGVTIEGQNVFFPKLYQSDLDGLEDGEINISPAPSKSDLDMLAGDWLQKNVSWEKKKEEEKKRGR